jgi:hypothetical protein
MSQGELDQEAPLQFAVAVSSMVHWVELNVSMPASILKKALIQK